MSYLNFPQLNFFGTFRADPSTLNNTPDNFNPNNNFPPSNGAEISNNIQLYWNPNGTAQFELDCKVGSINYQDGSTATTAAEDTLIGLALTSLNNTPLGSAKVVDLDPMQQNVTEIWGLRVGITTDSPNQTVLQGDFKPSAYSNAWIQVKNGRGDYAGSANFQSVLENPELANLAGSKFMDDLRNGAGDPEKLSINFVLRAFNSVSQQYLVNKSTLALMQKNGVSNQTVEAIAPLANLAQGRFAPDNPKAGLIPTTSYFTKLVCGLTGLKSTDQQIQTVLDKAKQSAGTPLTEYPFTWGQVFGTIGAYDLPSRAVQQPGHSFGPPPDFLTPDRTLAPLTIANTSGPNQVPTDSGAYSAYFSPFKVTKYAAGESAGQSDPQQTYVCINLGNSLVSTKPASSTNTFVDAAAYGNLALYCFGDVNKVIGKIDYSDLAFVSERAGIVNIPVDDSLADAIQNQPLGLVSLDPNDETTVASVFLRENAQGMYVRPNQFVFRMNPGVAVDGQSSTDATAQLNPETATVEFYVSRFGLPAANVALFVKLMPPLDAQVYSNNTLGTGGTSGMVNMSVPESALILQNGGQTSTDSNGIARLQITAKNPGNPRGYLDGQIYFLQYGFEDSTLQSNYIQSPDDLVSVQIYNEQPDIADITWENFVGPVLEQYGKIYPVMSFINLESENATIANAAAIRDALVLSPLDGGHMPATRDLSAGRLNLIVKWLEQNIPAGGK